MNGGPLNTQRTAYPNVHGGSASLRLQVLTKLLYFDLEKKKAHFSRQRQDPCLTGLWKGSVN